MVSSAYFQNTPTNDLDRGSKSLHPHGIRCRHDNSINNCTRTFIFATQYDTIVDRFVSGKSYILNDESDYKYQLVKESEVHFGNAVVRNISDLFIILHQASE